MIVIIYHTASGQIRDQISCLDSEVDDQYDDSEYSMLESSESILDQYIVAGVLTPRPAFSLAPTALTFTTAESITVTGIPVGTTVFFPGGSEVVDDGELEWDSMVAGDFTLRFENFPYVAEAIDVEVTDV